MKFIMGTSEQKRGIPAVLAGGVAGIAFALLFITMRPVCKFLTAEYHAEHLNAFVSFLIFLGGFAVGSVSAGFICDKKSAKAAILLSALLGGAGACLAGVFFDNAAIFYLCAVIMGAGAGGAAVTAAL